MRKLTINGKAYMFLCDSGACTTVVRQPFPGMKMSNKTIWVRSASGHVMKQRMTQPATIRDLDSGQETKISIMVDPSCPLNLLGRDLLTVLKIAIIPTADGGMTTATVEGDYQMLRQGMTEPQEMSKLRKLPDQVWSNGPTDVGLIKDLPPIKIETKPHPSIVQRQYPLSKEAIDGISPVIEDMLKAGILREIDNPVCLTPIFPVKKPTSKWRLVHDLRAVNDIVQPLPAKVANPHTILNSLKSTDKFFSVIDLSNAFFSVPLHKDSQGLFAFRFKNKTYTYTRLPQGFTHSPTMYSQALQMSMSTCPDLTGGQMLFYVDDILVTGDSQEQCKENTLVVLRHLYLQGHKVSQHKLQCWTESVRYLGHIISAQGKQITPERKEASPN
uniref:ribonuclease H n=1 Tax=Amphiprion ocellaris TaxID=80972 RepID=A0AAQ6AAX3_AMPOC